MSRRKYRWTPEEDEYISTNWGVKSIVTMAAHLDRTPRGVKYRGQSVLGLGPANDGCDYIVLGDAITALGYSRQGGRKIFEGAPVVKKVTAYSRRCTLIRHSDLMEFLRTHQERYDASRIEEYALGIEPQWLREKRRADIRAKQMGQKRWRDPWTPAEESEAVRLHYRGWTDAEIGKIHGRSAKAVHGCLTRNGVWNKKEKSECLSIEGRKTDTGQHQQHHTHYPLCTRE